MHRHEPAPRESSGGNRPRDACLIALLKKGYLVDVPVEPVIPSLFRQVLSRDAYADLVGTIVDGRTQLAGRVIWNVNSTARGGGVAEMLQSLIAYARGAGIDARWSVIQGTADFFRVTKRIHNQIQGFPGDGGELGANERVEYERMLTPAAFELGAQLHAGDIVLLHDPQTAGLAPELKKTGARIIWRCHVGIDSPTPLARKAWDFLRPYLADADAYVFSRASFVWDGLDKGKVNIIAPSIDPFTPKNNTLSPVQAAAILIASGLMRGYAASPPFYLRPNGTLGLVSHRAEMLEVSPMLPATRYVVQVSRWDRLKDPVGVLKGFADFVPESSPAHLVLAGPQSAAVTDDPEGAAVFDETARAWRELPPQAQARVHLASLPMQDLEQNAVIVNALQRRAAVVVQKSLAEGFGLTVSEAMWKARPVVASRIGGIQDQIEHAKTGLLLDDPTDLQAMGQAVSSLLAAPGTANQMGLAAQERVRQNFLNNRHLKDYVALFSRLVA